MLSADGDYTFGQGSANFFVNSPEGVAQLVETRLRLLVGEWFLDVNEGTPWGESVLAKLTKSVYDLAIRARILDTEGVSSITEYSSFMDTTVRKLTISAKIDTIYGPATINVVLP